MRFLFYVPDSASVRGGISVKLDIIDVLNANGIDAVALYERPDFEYSSYVVRPHRLWSPLVRRQGGNVLWLSLARRLRNRVLRRNRKPAGNVPQCEKWDVRPGDVVVVPEYTANWVPHQIPPHVPLVLLNQNPFALLRTFGKPGFESDRFAGSVSTSAACSAGNRMVFGHEPAEIHLFISQELYAYQGDKAFQVAYMPRKRRRDAAALVKALKATPGLEDVPFVEIDGVPNADAARILRESLFFLSFSAREGFGLPAAEAMATGALVIGYSGVGGNEFFDDTTGVRVPEDDLMQFYRQAVDTIRACKADMQAFEQRRKDASDIILQQYTRARFEEDTVRVFSDLRRQLAT